MSESIINILQILSVGGLISTGITLLFHHLSLKRQFRQTLYHKMIDRISNLVEHYYGQISSSSESLRNSLNQTRAAMKEGVNIENYCINSFYHLIRYLINIDNLMQERPRPLFTQLKAEKEYLYHIGNIYKHIPFNYIDISYLLSFSRKNDILQPLCEINKLIYKDKELKIHYDNYSKWIENNFKNRNKDADSEIHQVIISCFYICQILEDQIQKMYKLWYDRRIKKTKYDDDLYKHYS